MERVPCLEDRVAPLDRNHAAADAIIAGSLADIFCNNGCRNGVVPIVLPAAAIGMRTAGTTAA